MTHTDAIRTQIDQLEDEVRKDPRVKAIQHLKAALAVLEGGAVVAIPAAQDAVHLAPVRQPKRAFMPGSIKQDSKISRTNDLVGRYIDQHGPTHRTILVKMLTDAGLNDGVKDPIRAFATSLNTLKDYYTSDGMGTFRRRESVQSDAPKSQQEFPEGNTGGVAPPASSNPSSTTSAPLDTVAKAGGT